jgi:hypothetical protein
MSCHNAMPIGANDQNVVSSVSWEKHHVLSSVQSKSTTNWTTFPLNPINRQKVNGHYTAALSNPSAMR